MTFAYDVTTDTIEKIQNQTQESSKVKMDSHEPIFLVSLVYDIVSVQRIKIGVTYLLEMTENLIIIDLYEPALRRRSRDSFIQTTNGSD